MADDNDVARLRHELMFRCRGMERLSAGPEWNDQTERCMALAAQILRVVYREFVGAPLDSTTLVEMRGRANSLLKGTGWDVGRVGHDPMQPNGIGVVIEPSWIKPSPGWRTVGIFDTMIPDRILSYLRAGFIVRDGRGAPMRTPEDIALGGPPWRVYQETSDGGSEDNDNEQGPRHSGA